VVSTFTGVFDGIISYDFSTAKLEIFYISRLDPDAQIKKEGKTSISQVLSLN
jgi:hypothetical protein